MQVKGWDKCMCAPAAGCCVICLSDQVSLSLDTASVMQVDEEGMCKTSVACKGTHEVYLPVVAGSHVAYCFEIEKGTITSGGLTFGAVVKPKDGEELTVLQAQKYKPEDGLIKGEFVCPQAGMCVATFENSSMMMSKTVRFSVAVTMMADGDMSSQQKSS